MKILSGKGASGGAVIGKLRFLPHGNSGASETEPQARNSDPETELERLEKAAGTLSGELDSLYESALRKVGEREASIFEIHSMMLEDDDFLGAIRRLIREEGKSAGEAARCAGEELANAFRAMDTEYMRARSADVLAVSGRLCEILAGKTEHFTLTEPAVIAADDLTPAETIGLDREKVLGFVTSGGSTMSHTAILARMMGIPAAVSVSGLREEFDGHEVLLDGTAGTLTLDPGERAVSGYREMTRRLEEERIRLEKLRGKRCTNRNGERVFVTANVGEPGDVDEAVRCDAEGIGLFRSEFLFMRRNTPPTEEEQYDIYRTAARKLDGAECIVRTLDVGADKRIPYLTGDVREANPALGIRAVRLCLRMPELLLTQLRALYRAAAEENIAAMIPMIVLPSEVEKVREIAREARNSLDRDGLPWGRMKVGIMIETPSAAILADLLAPMVDFFSIGTNDLIQYTLAADRENPDVAYLTSPLPESVRRCIRMTCSAARREGIPVCVCGELGADPEETQFLLDAGVTKLSVAPKQILRVREKVMEATRVRI